MKLNYLIICVAISLIACSCTKDEPQYTSPKRAPHHETTKIDEELMTKDFDYAKSVLYDFVDQHDDVYGKNLFIFESPESMEKELQNINFMDYAALRFWQQKHGLMNNDIINSIIVHDSLQSNVFMRYGITSIYNDLDETLDEDVYKWAEAIEAKEDSAFYEYDEILRSKYSHYVKERKEDDGTTLYEPLGILDEQIFYNEKGIYICDGILFKKLEDGVLSCLFYNYPRFVDCKTSSDVANSQYKALAETDLKMNNLHLVRDTTFYSSDYNKNPEYKTSIHFFISVMKSPFGYENRRVSMCARNYHKNKSGSYNSVGCWTKINADVYTSCREENDWNFTFKTGWWMMKGNMVYSKLHLFRCGCPNTHFDAINVKAENQHGVKINEYKTF